jgi:hypothetical protein
MVARCEVPSCPLGIGASLSNTQRFKSPGGAGAPPAYSPLHKPVTQRASTVSNSAELPETAYKPAENITAGVSSQKEEVDAPLRKIPDAAKKTFTVSINEGAVGFDLLTTTHSAIHCIAMTYDRGQVKGKGVLPGDIIVSVADKYNLERRILSHTALKKVIQTQPRPFSLVLQRLAFDFKDEVLQNLSAEVSENLIKMNPPKRGMFTPGTKLGFDLRRVFDAVLVVHVEPDSQAAKAGITLSDALTEINDMSVSKFVTGVSNSSAAIHVEDLQRKLQTCAKPFSLSFNGSPMQILKELDVRRAGYLSVYSFRTEKWQTRYCMLWLGFMMYFEDHVVAVKTCPPLKAIHTKWKEQTAARVPLQERLALLQQQVTAHFADGPAEIFFVPPSSSVTDGVCMGSHQEELAADSNAFTLVDDNIEPISIYRANSGLEKTSWMKAVDMMFASHSLS